MRILLVLPVILMISCSSPSEKEEKAKEDSLVKSSEQGIKSLERSGDSIEDVNTSGTRKFP